MKLVLAGYEITIKVKSVAKWSRINEAILRNRKIAVENLAQAYTDDFSRGVFGRKLARIKAHRALYHSGLKDAKEWVEANFV